MTGRVRCEEGQLSIDFLIGFTIFMLGLIMVANMIPGLMVGLRRTTAIDYDAVAYRTGAILVEDPGWPLNPLWSTQSRTGVQRFGLALDKETPNVLSRTKVERFFDSTEFSYPDDYRSRLIFSDYPYHMNITLTEGSGYASIKSIGEPLPDLRLSGYGYVQRVVKIRELASIHMNMSEDHMRDHCVNSTEANASQTFTIRLNLTEILDKNISIAHRFDPRSEPLNITIEHLGAMLNNSDYNRSSCQAATPEEWDPSNPLGPDNATLKSIRLFKNGAPIPEPNVDQFKLTVSHSDGSSVSAGSLDNVNIAVKSDDRINLILRPIALTDLYESDILDIKFMFEDSPPRILINGTYTINYTTKNELHIPELHDGWLEVAIW